MAQIYELLWLKIILEDLKIKWETPMRLYCDNKSAAINIAHNLIQHDRTKHVEVDKHFIKEKLDSGLIYTPYVSTRGQLVDILTKRSASAQFQEIIIKLGMNDIYSPAWGGVLKIITVVIYCCVCVQLCEYPTVYICVYNPLFVGIFNKVVSNSFLILSFLLMYIFLGLYNFKRNTSFLHTKNS